MALDRASFEELFRAHAARVYSIGVRITGDRATAEDVVQETFVKAYTVADTTVFDDIGAWLSTVARNASLNAVRDRSRTVGLAEEAADGTDAGVAGSAVLLADVSPSADPERAAASSDAVRGAWELVDGLRPEARAAVVLRYAEDLPIEVIARTLGKSVNATTVLLHRARASLRAAYAARVFARAGLPDACRSRRGEIVDLVEGRPAPDELREHMAACSHCQQSADELRGMTRGFAVAPLFVVPATLGPKVAAVRRRGGRRGGRRRRRRDGGCGRCGRRCGRCGRRDCHHRCDRHGCRGWGGRHGGWGWRGRRDGCSRGRRLLRDHRSRDRGRPRRRGGRRDRRDRQRPRTTGTAARRPRLSPRTTPPFRAGRPTTG